MRFSGLHGSRVASNQAYRGSLAFEHYLSPRAAYSPSLKQVLVFGSFRGIGIFNYNAQYNLQLFDASTGNFIDTPLSVDGPTRLLDDIISDDTGGYYICGTFKTINGQGRAGVAQINSTGGLTSWNPSASAFVYTLAKIGDNVYIAGTFSSVAGVSRDKFACINTSGSLLAFNPGGTNLLMNDVAVEGDNLYYGGIFTTVFGVSRNRAACVNQAGVVQPWNPNVDGEIYSLHVYNGTVYLGGSFANVGGTARARLAAVDNSTGSLLSWNPSADNTVRSISGIGDNLYIVGSFQNIASTARKYIAAVNTSGSLLSWYPTTSYGAVINAVFTDGDNVYVAGDTNQVSGFSRPYLQVFNQAGTLQSLALNATYNSVMVRTDSHEAAKSSNTIALYTGAVPMLRTGHNTSNTSTTLRSHEFVARIQVSNSGFVPVPDIRVDGNVYAVAEYGDNIYIGGSFSNVLGSKGVHLFKVPSSGYNQPADWATGCFSLSGSISTVIPDGNGGFYIGGTFTQINNEIVSHLAHINSSGQLTSWRPSAQTTVTSLALHGTNVYIGGFFTSINGQNRTRLAAVNTSGSLLSWAPSSNSTVFAIAPIGDNIYLGGDFSTIGGSYRQKLAAVNTSGSLLSWNPSAGPTDAVVTAMTSIGDNLYFGGTFTSIASTTRNYIASVNTNGSLLAWNPNASNAVQSIASQGTNVYIGGGFSTVNGLPRLRGAIINTDGAISTWNAVGTRSGDVYGISVSGDRILVTGNFTYARELGKNVIWFDKTDSTGLVPKWRTFLLWPSSCAVSDGSGGYYFAGKLRALVHINSSGLATAWTPSVRGGSVHAIERIGDNVYIAGTFTEVNGTHRPGIAAINTSGSLLSWNPGIQAFKPNAGTLWHTAHMFANENTLYMSNILGTGVSDSIWTIVDSTTGSRILSTNCYATMDEPFQITSETVMWCSVGDGAGGVYIGGQFTSINGLSRGGGAYINSSGGIGSWNPNVSNASAGNARIVGIGRDGDNIYFGGEFRSCKGSTRNYFACVNSNGDLQSWNPSADNGVLSFIMAGINVFAVGTFTNVGGASRTFSASINTSGSILAWNPPVAHPSAPVHYSPVTGLTYLAQSGTGGERIAAVALDNTVSWRYNTNGNVSSITTVGSDVYLVGRFTQIEGVTRTSAAVINSSGAVLSWNPNIFASTMSAPDIVNVSRIFADGDNLYLSGEFTEINSTVRQRIALMNTSGSLLSFNPGLGAAATTITVSGANTFLGGGFNIVNPSIANGFTAINTEGNVVGWSPSVNGPVYDMRVYGTDIYLAGDFTKVNGSNRARIALINTSGSLQSWAPSADNTVTSIALGNQNTVYVGGTFGLIDGNVRNRLAAINTSGSVLSWNPSSVHPILSIEADGDNVYAIFAGSTGFALPREGGICINSAGSILEWNPVIQSPQYQSRLRLFGNDLLFTGEFAHLGIPTYNTRAGHAYNYSTAFIADHSGQVITWSQRNAPGGQNYGAISGDKFLVGMSSSLTIGSRQANSIAVLNKEGIYQNWTAALNSVVFDIAVSENTVYVVGAFGSAGPRDLASGILYSNTRNYVAAFTTSGSLTSWNPSCNANVHAIGVHGGNVYLGGAFTAVSGQTRNRLALVYASNGSADLNWHPSVSANVNAVYPAGREVYVGGDFTSVNSVSRGRFALINASGRPDSWAPSFDGGVQRILLDGSRVYATGFFTLVNGETRHGFAIINSAGVVQATPNTQAVSWSLYETANVVGAIPQFTFNRSSIGMIFRKSDGQKIV